MATRRKSARDSDERTEGNVYLCAPGYEDAVRLELLGARSLVPGALVTPRGKLADPVFARQVLPAALRVEGQGPSRLADAVLASLSDEHTHAVLSRRAALHVLAPDFVRRGSERPAPHPLTSAARELEELLEKKIAGRADKRGIAPADGPPDALLQVMIGDGWRAWRSLAPLRDDPLRAWPARFVAGRAPVAGFEDAPSSAYRKLVEALAWTGARPGPGEVVLDLGAAPGGWAYVLLELGAEVHAYDRAALSDRVARHPNLEHFKKDAFEHAPLAEAEWIVCDVIDEPARLLAVAREALQSERLRGLVLTVKLKRPVKKRAIADARRVLARARGRFDGRIKQLVHNKNEVTLLARRREP